MQTRRQMFNDILSWGGVKGIYYPTSQMAKICGGKRRFLKILKVFNLCRYPMFCHKDKLSLLSKRCAIAGLKEYGVKEGYILYLSSEKKSHSTWYAPVFQQIFGQIGKIIEKEFGDFDYFADEYKFKSVCSQSLDLLKVCDIVFEKSLEETYGKQNLENWGLI